jgi:AraC family transcriptional regulator, regulatory protein of adaptative response / DNA-3-methyladenine glycosylase II
MELDRQVCSRARLARDARFDGRFFIAVLTTRIYCRPICPARTCKESNVVYYPTAAAAAEAGFRPCLRCRPECSPGCPAWAGTQTTVSRALRLISESGLEDGGVEGLAEHLGVGARHLRRLFLKHLGASPSAVAQTRRLHFAKQLMDETTLPMVQVAVAAGFGCVRRFNDAIRKVYHRTPTQIRRLARQADTRPENAYRFRLDYRPPYNWTRILQFLAARATPGVEAVQAGRYRRTISLHGHHGFLEVSLQEHRNALQVCVQIDDPRSLFFIIERIRAMFDLNADWSVIERVLGADPVLAATVQAEAGLRVPGCWSGFELTTRAILGQQVSVKAATTLAGRIAASFGQPFAPADGLTHLFPTAEILADADLTRVGLTRNRGETVRALARAVCERRIRFEGVFDDHALRAQLLGIAGIGKWTAEYVAMRALCDPDAFPAGDLHLRRRGGNCTERELERRAESWRPWRAYAAMLLWQGSGVVAASPINRRSGSAVGARADRPDGQQGSGSAPRKHPVEGGAQASHGK